LAFKFGVSITVVVAIPNGARTATVKSAGWVSWNPFMQVLVLGIVITIIVWFVTTLSWSN
jgi:hypothetical protein